MNKQETNHNSSDLQKRILSETTALLYKAIPGSIVATIIISGILTAVIWEFFDKTLLVTWFIGVTSINIVRFVMYKYYLKYNITRNTRFWDQSFYFLLILNGLCFSVVGLVFLPDATSTYHYFPIMVLIGLATGAVSSLSFSLRNITTYFILLLVPVFVSEVIIYTFLSLSIAGLVLLSMAFSLVNAKIIYQTSIENITLNFLSEKHNEILIESEYVATEANNAKSKFIALMSHELRTPLNAILGYTQLLRMSDKPILNEEQDEQTQGIYDAGTYLLSLIEELLDVSKIEANKMEIAMEAVSVADILQQSLTMLEHLASDSKVRLINNVKNKYLIKADAKRLKQIFINLISNAIKYNDVDGNVTINAEIQPNKKVRFSFMDSGYGLTNEQKAELFKPFQRFDTRKEGIGLGLYIVYHLVNMMDGEIGVESEHEKGSTFWLEFDLAE